MSTFSSDAEEAKHRAFVEHVRVLRARIKETQNKINILVLDISRKQANLHEARKALLCDQLILAGLTQSTEAAM